MVFLSAPSHCVSNGTQNHGSLLPSRDFLSSPGMGPTQSDLRAELAAWWAQMPRRDGKSWKKVRVPPVKLVSGVGRLEGFETRSSTSALHLPLQQPL